MEDRNIIAILIIIIAIIAVIMGAMLMPSPNAQKDSKIAITGNKTIYEGDGVAVKLTDMNGTPIKKEIVNVTITNKDGKVVVNESVKTDFKGKAKLNLDLDAGKYTVNATFAGNDNFTGNSTSKKITIEEVAVEEEVVQEPVQTQTVSESSYSDSSSEDTDGVRVIAVDNENYDAETKLYYYEDDDVYVWMSEDKDGVRM